MRAAKPLIRILVGLFTLMVAAQTSAATLESLVSPGPLSSAHTDLEAECSACHAPIADTPQETLCVACHSDIGEDLMDDTGLHGLHPEVEGNECQLCHTEHEGEAAETLTFDWKTFDHNHTDFPLLWVHNELECASCHADGLRFADAPTPCVGCHAEDDPHSGNLGGECESCHTERDWTMTLFAHGTMTGFELTGEHKNLTCSACHDDAGFSSAGSTCVACHEDDDVHRGSFGSDCAQCHVPAGWAGSFFNHGATGFLLDGGHGGLACASCHAPQRAEVLDGGDCSACHSKDDAHDGTLGNDCGSCHGIDHWAQTAFSHVASSGFALHGAHANLACASCHTNDPSDPLPRLCGECHGSDDPHGGELGNGCESCHGEAAWHANVRFDHHLTAFPLLGSHSLLECSACHVDARFRSTPGECAACHTDEDPHDGIMGTACGTCHNPNDWRATLFDHELDTGFTLPGAHDQLTCAACHEKPAFLAATSAEACVQCHRQDDVHAGRFGSDCNSCHRVETFAELRRLE